MKRIEDKDVKNLFNKLYNKLLEPEGDALPNEKALAEHFFQAGRESMAKEFWTARPKRTISRVIVGSQGNLFALSSDGRLYGLREFDGTNLPEWLPYAELPQGD